MLSGYQRRFKAVEVLAPSELGAMHQGALEIRDNPGRGLIFRVKLPFASTDGCTRSQ